MAASLGNKTQVKRHKWSFALTSMFLESAYLCITDDPLSKTFGAAHSASKQSEMLSLILIQKSWDVALAPWKQVPMNLFIMYMAGNSISIFPIMMVGMLFLRPVKALLTIQSTFKMIEGGQAILQKIVYLFGNLACLALALYKCSSMGLLPTHASDWLDFVEPLQRIEHSGGGIILS
ncbi:membrane protein, putative [Ixodes scapularis]|uniref:ER membrane protein complex subunit 4 n=1 Tax=Ixodes scapularis TaxID=6945 RepID=B7PMF9_IXOSC|nr:membrane protein, putative [Ixodes scapularis]|eukprot:XP_002434957.1 membrane protein, putative [Ixodes scapularis]